MEIAPDWDSHQSAICHLYWTERKELPEVMKIMEHKYGFVATRKQYKKQLKAWGYEKNIKAHEMRAMLQIQRRRLVEEGKQTRFKKRGVEVAVEKFARFRKRYKITELDEMYTLPNERATTPEYVSYETPEPESLQHSPLSAASNQSGDPSDDPGFPVGDEGHIPSVPGRASVEYSPVQVALDAFRNCSTLHRAVIKGDVEKAKALLKAANADPNPVVFGGITPLHIAAFQRNIRLINLLRENGAKLDAMTNYDQSVLFFAVCSPDRLKGGDRAGNSLKALRDLPVQRTDENTVDTINALYDCPVGWARLLRIVDKADSEGITPLMAAAEGGFIRAARLLLQRGARPEKKDKASYPVLRYAASCSSPDLVRLLLEADTRIQDRDLSHMLKLVTRTLPTARPDNDGRGAGSRNHPNRVRDSSFYEGSAVVLDEIARVYREMGVLEKLVNLAEQQEQ
ncbi:hypothetical protein V8F20_002305, partial [Naviculisporaceae sp. PSN 640]